MKFIHYFLFCCLICSFTTQAQVLPIDSTTRKVTFQEMVSLDSLSKDTLYTRASEWMANYYKTSKFDINDMAGGKLGIEGYFVVSLTYDFKYKSENNVAYDILIIQKDGKYKYSLTNLCIYSVKTSPKSAQPLETASAKMRTQNKKEFVSQLNSQVKTITEDLKETMTTGKIKKVDAWK